MQQLLPDFDAAGLDAAVRQMLQVERGAVVEFQTPESDTMERINWLENNTILIPSAPNTCSVINIYPLPAYSEREETIQITISGQADEKYRERGGVAVVDARAEPSEYGPSSLGGIRCPQQREFLRCRRFSCPAALTRPSGSVVPLLEVEFVPSKKIRIELSSIKTKTVQLGATVDLWSCDWDGERLSHISPEAASSLRLFTEGLSLVQIQCRSAPRAVPRDHEFSALHIYPLLSPNWRFQLLQWMHGEERPKTGLDQGQLVEIVRSLILAELQPAMPHVPKAIMHLITHYVASFADLCQEASFVYQQLCRNFDSLKQERSCDSKSISISMESQSFVFGPTELNFPCGADGKKSTPLIKAARAGLLETVQLLIENKAVVNTRNKNGVTALYIAAWADQPRVVEYLLECGADTTLGRCRSHNFCKGTCAETPYQAAMRRGSRKVLKETLIHPYTKQPTEKKHSSAKTVSVGTVAGRKPKPPCRYFARGHCNKGQSCSFRHEQVGGIRSSNVAADSATTQKVNKLCHFFRKGRCKYDVQCRFRHDTA
eukprot:gb/GEZN01004789.1/.p1 GENE.gb/GEZN01004789.1/~~gb/GEZN01004789.1/.p1  ORF type:complete len:545 (+),score=47.24 gb/GEZN01004789.1/:114-1748(+)